MLQESTDAYSYYPFYYSGTSLEHQGCNYWECDEYGILFYDTAGVARTTGSTRGWQWDNLFSVQLHTP